MSTEKGKAIVAIDIEGEDLDDAADKLVEKLKADGLNAEVEEVLEAGNGETETEKKEEEEEPATGDEPGKIE